MNHAAAPPDEVAQSDVTTTVSTTSGANSGAAVAPGALPSDVYAMTLQMQQLMRTQQDMTMYMHTMAANYDALVRELLACKRHLVEQDRVIGNLLRYLGPSVQPQLTAAGPGGGAPAAGPASLADAIAAQQLMRTSSLQMLSEVFAADARAASQATGTSRSGLTIFRVTLQLIFLGRFSPSTLGVHLLRRLVDRALDFINHVVVGDQLGDLLARGRSIDLVVHAVAQVWLDPRGRWAGRTDVAVVPGSDGAHRSDVSPKRRPPAQTGGGFRSRLGLGLGAHTRGGFEQRPDGPHGTSQEGNNWSV